MTTGAPSSTRSSSRSSTRALGQRAEQLAAQYLQQQGIEILERNYHTRLGELDIIGWDPAAQSLVFVEVRYRKRQDFGSATDSVDARKQQKLRLAAEHWLQSRQRLNDNCRFDVIACSGPAFALQWLQNAF